MESCRGLSQGNGAGSDFPYCHGRGRLLCASYYWGNRKLFGQRDRQDHSDGYGTFHCMPGIPPGACFVYLP